VTWLQLPGWLTTAEGLALQRLAANKTVLELGSYLGRSTVCMADVANHVTAVDWHHGDADTGPADTLAEFLANLHVCGVAGKVLPIPRAIEDASIGLASYDLVFVDAAHDAESVERHTRIALHALRAGGIIAWHDAHYDSVQQAIRACGLAPTEMVDSLAWVEV
jgi:predicted O-methyltransferase YrrM